MVEEAGEENFFLFGLSAQRVADSRAWCNPRWHYDNDPEARAALDLMSGDHFSRYEPGIFAPIHDALLEHGDHYMHLADLKSYLDADQRLCGLHADADAWARKAIFECGPARGNSRAIGQSPNTQPRSGTQNPTGAIKLVDLLVAAQSKIGR
jgi:glucan phosphorylase